MSEIIKLISVDKIYTGAIDVQVLFGIDLSFEPCSFNSIVGQSGSGKTTLLNIMGTLDRPSHGEVIINGQKTSKMTRSRLAELRNREIGFVFQFHYLLPEFTAFENVLMPYRIYKRSLNRDILKRVDDLFELMGISGVKKNLATRMSGGQQQRTAIIRALVNNPRVILADEPSGNLDSENTDNIYRIFRRLNVQFGTTFIIITHDRRIAEQTDRIIEIRDGKILSDTKNLPTNNQSQS